MTLIPLRQKIFRLALLAALIVPPATVLPFGKNKVNREVFSWAVMKTVHFNVYYPRGMEGLARFTVKLSEEGYVHIANYLRHELTQVIPIIIYPSHIDFQENNIIMQIIGEGTGGFTEAFKNRVVVPFNGSYAEFRHVLVHELTHAFQFNMLFDDTSGAVRSRLSFSGIPLWLLEGMSEYLSIGFDETADMVMRDIFYNDRFATLMDLTRMRVESGYLLYKEGQAFYYFLERRYGKNAIGDLFRDLRDIRDVDKAFTSVTGKTLEEVNEEWVMFFKKRYYPLVKGKNFDQEEGDRLTDHRKSYSSFNVCPAVSPDGKKIAYITNRNIYSTLSVMELEGRKKKKVKTLVRGDTSAKFEGMHLLSNYLTWTADGKGVLFVSQSAGRDVVFLVDAGSGRVLRELKFPFRGIKDPSLSADGTLLAFIGIMNGRSDVFVYGMKTGKLRRVTDDLYAERYPRVLPGNDAVIYSSSYRHRDGIDGFGYSIFRKKLSGEEPEIIVQSAGSNLQADISPDGKKVIYISNRTGIYNAYIKDLNTGEHNRVTNVLCGVYYPRWFPGGEKIAFVAYQNLGYDIFIKDLDKNSFSEGDPPLDTEHVGMKYGPSYFNPDDSVCDEYTPRVSPDMIFFGIGGTIGYGLSLIHISEPTRPY